MKPQYYLSVLDALNIKTPIKLQDALNQKTRLPEKKEKNIPSGQKFINPWQCKYRYHFTQCFIAQSRLTRINKSRYLKAKMFP